MTHLFAKGRAGKCLMAFAFLFIFAYLLKWGVFCPYFWYDESGQFSMALGQNHYSEPFSSPGGLADVLENNRYYNLDPGGFSVILHYWAMMGTHYAFLRLLPFLFFLGFLFFSYLLSRRLGLGKSMSAMVTLGLLSQRLFYDYSFELRAYSMEMCGVMVALYLYIKMQREDQTKSKHLFLLGILVAFFMTSRYCFVLFAAVLSAWIFFKEIFVRKAKFISYFSYAIPVVVMLLVIYFGMMYIQNKDATSLDYVPYIKNDITQLANLFCLKAYILIGLCIYEWHRNKRVAGILLFSTLLSIFIILLSIFGLYPVSTSRSMSASLLQYYAFFYYAACWCRDNMKQVSTLTIIYPLYIIFFCFYGSFEAAPKWSWASSTEFFTFLQQYDKSKTLYLWSNFIPDVRYDFEYGILKDKQEEYGYPDRFVFGNVPYNLVDGVTTTIPRNNLPDEVDCDYYLLTSRPAGFKTVEGYKNLFVRENE